MVLVKPVSATGREPMARIAAVATISAAFMARPIGAVFFGHTGDVAEVADRVEVCFAAAALHGVNQDELLAIARDKRAQRGGFDGRFVWMGNLPGTRERLQGRQRDGGAGANGLAGLG